MRSFVFLALPSLISGVEREMTVSVGAGKEECFFESVPKDNTLTIDYQVIDTGTSLNQMGDLDINFKLIDPRGHPLFAEFKKSEGTHSHKALDLGDFKICFDNSFSYLTSKTIYFEMVNENEDADYDDLAAIFEEEEDYEEYYEVQVSDIEVKLKKIKEDLSKSRHLQDQIKMTDLKDRSIMEHNFERVNFMSTFYVVVLVGAGLAQVILLRSLFDEKSKLNPLWRKAFKN